jgi:hypothetical protein
MIGSIRMLRELLTQEASVPGPPLFACGSATRDWARNRMDTSSVAVVMRSGGVPGRPAPLLEARGPEGGVAEGRRCGCRGNPVNR